MRTPAHIALVVAVLGAGAGLLLMTRGDRAKPSAAAPAPPSAAQARASTASNPSRAPRFGAPRPSWNGWDQRNDPNGEFDPETGLTPEGKLHPKSEQFAVRVDEEIPRRLYSEAAGCYEGGLQRDEKVRLEIKVSSVDGAISVPTVKVLYSNISDPKLVDCIVEQVKATHWQDDEMPSWEDTDELLIRVRGMKKYLGEDFPDKPEDEQ
jgi:hypothetical protein